MTNFEYLIKNYPDYINSLVVYAIWRSNICPGDICNTCPLYSKDDIICYYDKQRISRWLNEERKDD